MSLVHVPYCYPIGLFLEYVLIVAYHLAYNLAYNRRCLKSFDCECWTLLGRDFKANYFVNSSEKKLNDCNFDYSSIVPTSKEESYLLRLL